MGRSIGEGESSTSDVLAGQEASARRRRNTLPAANVDGVTEPAVSPAPSAQPSSLAATTSSAEARWNPARSH